MAVAKKGRRQIVINDRLYFWYVVDSQVGFLRQQTNGVFLVLHVYLHIVSEDKHFNVQYLTNQSLVDTPYLPHVIVIGQEFAGLAKAGGGCQRVAVPRWDEDGVSPGFVGRLVDWCMNPNKEIRLVNSEGEYI